MKITKENVKQKILVLVQTIACGIVIGIVIGIYQWLIHLLVELSHFLYGNENIFYILLIIILGIGLAFVNYYLIYKAEDIQGSGIPYLELGIHKKRRLDWKNGIIAVFVNSCISTLIGFPLGSEGPSVTISGKICKMIEDVSKVEADNQKEIACGVGFGCAFLSPIAGISFVFEEFVGKFKIGVLIRAIIMMLSAYFICNIFHHKPIFILENFDLPSINEYYVFLILIVVNVLLSIGFTKLLTLFKKIFVKFQNHKIVEYRNFILFAIVIVLNIVCLPLMGSGLSIMNGVTSYSLIWIVALILIFRFIITILSGTGKITGGLVVPMMALGALSGQIVYLICNQLFNLSNDVQLIIILISMCMVFATVTKVPLTSTILVYSIMLSSTNDYLHSMIIIPLTAICMYVPYYLTKWLKIPCIYDLLIEIIEEDEKKRKKI